MCAACTAPCAECSTSTDTCTKCVPGAGTGGDPYLYLDSATDRCVETCPAETYADRADDASNPRCLACGSDCKLCGATADECTQCNHVDTDGKYLTGTTCVLPASCPTGEFGNADIKWNPVCERCVSPCVTCTSRTVCTKCEVGGTQKYLHPSDGSCVEDCPATYYEDIVLVGDNPRCLPCADDCSLCGSTADECTQCNHVDVDGKYLSGTTCVEDCPGGEWG